MSTWMTDEEIAELQKARPTTGNDFLDAFQLGYDMGCRIKNAEVEKANSEKSNEWSKCYKAEQERDALKAENEALRAEVAKLRKKLRKARKSGVR